MNKRINNRIKKYLETRKGVSRKELATALQLNMRTVTAHLESLCRQGLIKKVNKKTLERGRPEALYHPAAKENFHVAGFFLHDTKIVCTVKEFTGKAIETHQEPYHLNWATINHTVKRIMRILSTFKEKGITANAADLVFFGSRNTEFKRIVGKHLQTAAGIPVSISNPISAFAWEARAKNPQKNRISVVHFGMSQIECCCIENSSEIDDNYEQQLSHIQISKDGPPCHCGKQGCLEFYTVGFSLIEEYRELKNISPYEEINIYDCFQAGDPDAISIVTKAKNAVIIALKNIMLHKTPDLLILLTFENELMARIMPEAVNGSNSELNDIRNVLKICEYPVNAGISCASASAEKALYLNKADNWISKGDGKCIKE